MAAGVVAGRRRSYGDAADRQRDRANGGQDQTADEAGMNAGLKDAGDRQYRAFRRIAPNGRGCLARFCLCNGVLEPAKPFRALCLCIQKSVSRQRRLRFEETRFDTVGRGDENSIFQRLSIARGAPTNSRD